MKTNNLRSNGTSHRVQRLAKMGMMAAVACVIGLIRFPLIPGVSFLTYDLADIPILVTTFAFGVLPGMLLLAVVSFIQAFLMGGDGVYGFVMHIIASGSFLIVAGLFYQRHKTKKVAVISMVVASFVMTAIMICANYFVTPLFLGTPKDVVVALLPYIGLFNLIKGGLNSIITFVVYKRISKFLHAEGMISTREKQPE